MSLQNPLGGGLQGGLAGGLPGNVAPVPNPYGQRAALYNLHQANQMANITTSSSSSNYLYLTTSGSATTACVVGGSTDTWGDLPDEALIAIRDGREVKIALPDGTVIEVQKDGSFVINDKDAKVIYRAQRMRDFNPFLNVSDRLEEFIRYCGENARVGKADMLQLPLSLFIGWLVLKAAEADQEPAPPIQLLPDLRKAAQPHCQGCGQFLAREVVAKKLTVCGAGCFERVYAKAA